MSVPLHERFVLLALDANEPAITIVVPVGNGDDGVVSTMTYDYESVKHEGIIQPTGLARLGFLIKGVYWLGYVSFRRGTEI